MNARHIRIEAIAPWVAGFLLALPTLVAFYPPMSDLPYHEAAIGILRHFGDTSMFPRGLYRYNLGEPNQLFHMAGWALSYVVSTRWAVKLVVAATIVAIPPCAARLARHVGASPLASLLVAPMAIGWLFYWGLIANLIGLAALLAVLPTLDRFARAPTTRGALRASSAVLLLYFAHEAMMFLYAGAALGLALVYPWSRKGTSLRLLPALLSAVVTVGQAKWQLRYMSATVGAVPRLWTSFGYKLRAIPNLISPASDKAVLWAMSSLCGIALAALFWLRARERRSLPGAKPDMPGLGRVRSALLAYRWELLAVACLGAYFAFPLTLNGATFVYHRWFPPGFAVLVIVAAPRDLFVREARIALVALPALPMGTLLIAWSSFADSSRAYVALEPLLGRVELGSAVAGLELGPGDPSRTFSLGPAVGRILATRGGRLVYAFTDSSISPVVTAKRYAWDESLIRVAFDSYAFRPAQDLYRFRYVLVRAGNPSLAVLAIRAMMPEAEYVAGVQEWLLFRSRVPVRSLLSRDFWLYGPPPEAMRDRINALVAAQREADKQAGAEPGSPDETQRSPPR
jgi:hypothetical protein